MTVYAGSLLADIQRLQELGHTVGVVVIDEQGPGGYDETYDQQAVLMFATRNGCPIWLVELNPTAGTAGQQPNLKTRTRLRALLPPGTPVVTKPFLNAFDRTNLHDLLQQEEISAFVIMGYAVNCCVRQTAVGGYDRPGSGGIYRPGATGHGYIVMSCPQILRGGDAAWKNDPNVWFFSSV